MEITKELIERAQGHDEDALSEILLGLRNMMYFTAKAYTCNDVDADEVVQRASIKICFNINKLQNTDNFYGWVKTIVKNEGINFAKSAENRKTSNFSDLERETESGESVVYDVTDEKVESQPELMLDRQMMFKIINNILDSLSKEQSQAIRLFFYEERKISEIAEIMGTNDNTTKTRLKAAKAKIKDCVEKMERTEGISLYGMAPVSFFVYIMKKLQESPVISSAESIDMAAPMQRQFRIH